MRYPTGKRPTLADTVQAATEAAQLTKMRYRVTIVRRTGKRFMSDNPRMIAEFHFLPAVTPDPELHDGIDV